MTVVFYISAAIAVIAGVLVITRLNPMHALVNLVTLFLAIASAQWSIGAPFAAALQIVIYAGAIVVLFVFGVMILNLGEETMRRERQWLSGSVWVLPLLLACLLVAQFVIALLPEVGAGHYVGPKSVGTSLFTTYLIGVELASLLLLAGLIAGFHFGAHLARPEADSE